MIQNLQTHLEDKGQKIKQLTDSIDVHEQYTRKDDIVFADLLTTHLSYARAVSCGDEKHDENASSTERELFETQVADF